MAEYTFDRTLKVNAALSFGGLIIWLLISMTTNRREAWDSDVFWSLGVPLMLLLNAVAAFLDPSKIVLKGMLSIALQPVAMIIMAGEIGSMFPLGLILFGFMGLFYSVGGAIGAFLKKQFFSSRETKE